MVEALGCMYVVSAYVYTYIGIYICISVYMYIPLLGHGRDIVGNSQVPAS